MKKISVIPLLLSLCSLKAANEPTYLPEQPTFEAFDPAPGLALKEKKSPFIAVGLATLIPGLGHAYIGDFQTAGGMFASCGVLGGLSLWDQNPYQVSNLITAQNLISYNVYAAYRDVRIYNQNDGYYYKMPTDSLSSLALAPFRWNIIKKPEVWGGILGALTLAAVVTHFTIPENMGSRISLSSNGEFSPLVAFPVAIGEEALFRGFLQSALYDFLSPAGSIILSSIAFGAAHIPNALMLPKNERNSYYTFSLPLITTFGAYFGYLTYKNCSLRESVAIHAWYDFILFAASYSVAQSASTQTKRVGFSLSF